MQKLSKKNIRWWESCVLTISLFSCAQHAVEDQQLQWDFNQQVQFKQSRISKNSYHIVVIANGKTHFSTLATFLMRRSLELCKSYGFKIKVLAGVESYYHKLESPNMLMPSLSANVYCSGKLL